MADGHWNPQMLLHPSGGMLKRPRPDSDLPPSGMPSALMQNYLPRDAHTGYQLAKDPKATGSVYDRYLQNVPLPYTSGEASNFGGLARAVGGGMPGFSIAGPAALGHSGAGGGPDLAPNGRAAGFGGQLPLDAMARPGRETAHLPPDASNTLYVEGLPSNCTKREVAHIFRPFVGYKEVRLVSKESRHRDGDPLILCFVDFINPACAATALSALQGYRMDEHDRDSAYLRLQFSTNPGPRSGSGSGSGAGSGRRRKR